METKENIEDQISLKELKEVTLKELFQNVKEYLGVITQKKLWIIAVALLFGAYGFWSNKTAKIKYTAEQTFMIAEDESGGSSGGITAILGQFGLPSTGSKFNYSKIVELAKSTKIMEKVIFDSAIPTGSTVQVEHSYKWINVCYANNLPWIREIQLCAE